MYFASLKGLSITKRKILFSYHTSLVQNVSTQIRVNTKSYSFFVRKLVLLILLDYFYFSNESIIQIY